MIKNFTLLGLIIAFFYSCEDVIDVPLEEAETRLVVDAWINNMEQDQSIILSLSQPYFDNSPPPVVTDAVVRVIRDDGMEYVFSHINGGEYVWAANESSLGESGHQFTLNIRYKEDIYTATTAMYRVPMIDSLGIEFRKNEIFLDDGLYGQFYARDFQGLGDTYWIKTFRNGEFLDKTQELNIAYDAGFDAGTGIDGLVFIPPIRELVNPLNEDLLPIPYLVGDEIKVEIHSISNDAFNFLEIARDQINNGDNGIFSIPLANTQSNIRSETNLVLGFFNVAAVSSKSRIIEE